MTIKFVGHVVSLAQGLKGAVTLTLQPESRYCPQTVTIEASRGETDAYRPGMPVEFAVIPRQDLEKPQPRSMADHHFAITLAARGVLKMLENHPAFQKNRNYTSLRDAITAADGK